MRLNQLCSERRRTSPLQPARLVTAVAKLVPSVFDRLLDTEQFHLKNEGAVRRYLRTRTAFAVSQVRRNLELEFVAHLHELKPLSPATDDTIQRKADRLATLHGA